MSRPLLPPSVEHPQVIKALLDQATYELLVTRASAEGRTIPSQAGEVIRRAFGTPTPEGAGGASLPEPTTTAAP